MVDRHMVTQPESDRYDYDCGCREPENFFAKDCQQKRIKNIGVKFHADAPAGTVPCRHIKDVKTVDQENIGEQRDRRFIFRVERLPRTDNKFRKFQNDKTQQHENMHRVQATNAQENIVPDRHILHQPVLVTRGDDKTAQHKKEIHEQRSVMEESDVMKMGLRRRENIEVQKDNEAGADAAPCVQYFISFRPRSHIKTRILYGHGYSNLSIKSQYL